MQDNAMTPKPIAIVGAGLAGLTLNRALARHGIRSIIYERASASPRHNYGITLFPTTYEPLLSILDTSLAAFTQRVAVDSYGSTSGTGFLDREQLLPSTVPPPRSMRVNRAKLETLLTGDDGARPDVRYSHEATGIIPSEDSGSASLLLFKSVDSSSPVASDSPAGTESHAAIIDTEGVHSSLRTWSIGHIHNVPSVLPFVTIRGRRRVRRAVFDSKYAPALRGSKAREIKTEEGVVLGIYVDHVNDEDVGITWIYSRAARLDTTVPDALFQPDRSTSEASRIPDAFFDEAKHVLDTDSVRRDPLLAEVFDVQKMRNDRLLSWLMRSVDLEIEQLRQAYARGVLLIGDAAHAQPILGGEGANQAIADALSLAEHIAVHGVGGLGEWYETALLRWEASCQRARRAIFEMHEGGSKGNVRAAI